MASEALVREATEAWLTYGEAIKMAFNFDPNGNIVAEPLLAAINGSDVDVQHFIDYVRVETEALKKSKWIGER